MFSCYASIILLSWMAPDVLCTLIRENGRISRADERLIYATYMLIAVSAPTGWCSVHLRWSYRSA